MTLTERMDAKRRSTLTLYALAFFVWCGCLAATVAFPLEGRRLPEAVLRGLIAGQIGGFVIWAALLLRLLLLGARIRRTPELAAAMNDERSKANTRAAFVAAFWAVIAAAGVALVLDMALSLGLGAPTLAILLIWIGVTVAITGFVVLERRDAA